MVSELRAVLESLRHDLSVRASCCAVPADTSARWRYQDMAGARSAGGDAYRNLNRAFGSLWKKPRPPHRC